MSCTSTYVLDHVYQVSTQSIKTVDEAYFKFLTKTNQPVWYKYYTPLLNFTVCIGTKTDKTNKFKQESELVNFPLLPNLNIYLDRITKTHMSDIITTHGYFHVQY